MDFANPQQRNPNPPPVRYISLQFVGPRTMLICCRLGNRMGPQLCPRCRLDNNRAPMVIQGQVMPREFRRQQHGGFLLNHPVSLNSSGFTMEGNFADQAANPKTDPGTNCDWQRQLTVTNHAVEQGYGSMGGTVEQPMGLVYNSPSTAVQPMQYTYVFVPNSATVWYV